MEHLQQETSSSGNGLLYVSTSLASMILGWITIHSVYEVLQIAATIVSIGAALMAIRHYWLTDKKTNK